MSGPPPDWDDAPPPDPGSYGQPSGQYRGGGGGQQRRQQPKMTDEQVKHAAEAFYAWMIQKDTVAQLRLMLPDNVEPEVFITTCKTAVLTRPQLLREDLRPSLMVAVMKGASQGLKPDGKEGALVTRYDSESRSYVVVWQPMVWGLCKLGRETGAIKSIRAVIVYNGEPFEIIQGEDDIIRHTVDIDIEEEAFTALHEGVDQWGNPKANPDAFFEFVRAAYCIITGIDGTVTKRWMTRKRLQTLRDAAKAKNGPWNSVWMPEMICKSVILFTSKWINLDAESVHAKRFQSALLQDLEVDFGQGNQIGHDAPQPRQQAALEAPGTKLDLFEQMHRTREPVTVGAEVERHDARSSPSPTNTVTEEAGQPGASSAPPSADQPVDPALAAQVNIAIQHISEMSQQEVYGEVGTDRYRSLVRRLNNAGQLALLKRLTDAVTAAQRGTAA
jgi:recombinational DNA repair protein RecT